MLELFTLPFMQRALLIGVLLALLLAALGVFVTLRKMAFFGDGIAHSSLAGIAIALAAGLSPLPIALAWAVLVAVLIYRLERSSRLPSDTLIGIFFTASMAGGVVLMSFTSGYRPELLSFLFGNVLAVRTEDVWISLGVALAVAAWLIPAFRSLTYLSLAEDNAAVAGLRVRLHTVLLYIALALTTVLGVKMLGVILVSALLVLPPATARLLSGSFRGYVACSLVVAELTMLTGIVASYRFDLPTGATVVLVGTAMFFLALVLNGGRRV